MTAFANWCALRNVPAFPARPADVASFVSDCAPLGIAKIWPMVATISEAHVRAGLADPTAGGWVSAAVNEVSGIEPPRSWPKQERQQFYALPYNVQLYLNHREAQRDRTVRLAQDAAAKAAKKGWIDGERLSA